MSLACYKDYSLVINPAVTPVTAPNEYWRFDSLSGGNYIGSIHSTVATPNAVTSIAGIISNGVESTTTFPSWVTTGGSANLGIGNVGCSASIWFKQINAPHVSITGGPILTITWPDTRYLFVEFNWSGDPPVLPIGGLSFPGGGAVTGSAITVGDWYHLVVTVNFSTKIVTFYINGVSVGTTGYTTNPTLNQGAGSLSLAMVNFFGTNAEGQDAAADELGWWSNHILTPTEVTTLYNGGSGARPSGA